MGGFCLVDFSCSAQGKEGEGAAARVLRAQGELEEPLCFLFLGRKEKKVKEGFQGFCLTFSPREKGSGILEYKKSFTSFGFFEENQLGCMGEKLLGAGQVGGFENEDLLPGRAPPLMGGGLGADKVF